MAPRKRRSIHAGPTFRWKETGGAFLVGVGVVLLLFVVFIVFPVAWGRDESMAVPWALLAGALLLILLGAVVLERARAVPGWVYTPATIAEAFDGLDEAALTDAARALASTDEVGFEALALRAMSGRFSRVLECLPGLCRLCGRAARTRRILFIRAFAAHGGVVVIHVWQYLSTVACRECAGRAMGSFLGSGDSDGVFGLIAGILWLPWNLPQYLLTRLLPPPPSDALMPAGTLRLLAPRGPRMVEELRGGVPLRRMVEGMAEAAGEMPGRCALFLAAYGELCRRLGPRGTGGIPGAIPSPPPALRVPRLRPGKKGSEASSRGARGAVRVVPPEGLEPSTR